MKRRRKSSEGSSLLILGMSLWLALACSTVAVMAFKPSPAPAVRVFVPDDKCPDVCLSDRQDRT